MKAVNKEEYIPGVCNIGPNETKRRLRFAIFGVALFIVYALVVYYMELDPVWRLPLFIPAFMAAIGFLQARNQFCVRFGLSENSRFGGIDTARKEFAEKDRKRAIKIIVYAIIIAAFVTAVVYKFPV